MKISRSACGRTAPSDTISPAYAAFPPDTGYIRIRSVAAMCGIAVSTVWAWAAQGRFPRPTKLSHRVSVWSIADIRIWLANPAAWQAANALKKEGTRDE